jgi:hypothetical protein
VTVGSQTVELRDGTRALIRPIGPTDRERLREGFEGASAESILMRFRRPICCAPLNAPLRDNRGTVAVRVHPLQPIMGPVAIPSVMRDSALQSDLRVVGSIFESR